MYSTGPTIYIFEILEGGVEKELGAIDSPKRSEYAVEDQPNTGGTDF